jgi:hypothetical protein
VTSTYDDVEVVKVEELLGSLPASKAGGQEKAPDPEERDWEEEEPEPPEEEDTPKGSTPWAKKRADGEPAAGEREWHRESRHAA